MTWVSKTWSDRVSQYPTRRLLVKADSSMEQVTVQRDEGTITSQGDSFTAVNMNNLEGRIGTAIAEVCTTDAYANLVTTQKTVVGAINEVAHFTAQEYSEEAGYNIGDLTLYNGVIYKCDVVIPVPAGPFDPQEWVRGSVSDAYMKSYNPSADGSFSLHRYDQTVVGAGSFASYSEASGTHSTAFSYGRAEGDKAFAVSGLASGDESVSLGGITTSQSTRAVALGGATVDGLNSFGMGDNNEVDGEKTAVFGHSNHALGDDKMVFGRAATEDNNGSYVLQIGNGVITEDPQTHAETVTERKDCLTVDWNGNQTISGNLVIGGTPTLANHAARLADVNKELTEQANITAVSVQANTATNVHNFKLDAGVYALHVVCRCSAGSQGRRHLALFNSDTGSNFYGSGYFAETEANAIGSETVTLNLVTFVSIANNQSPIYIRVTSGSAVTVTPRVQYYKIG